MFRQSLYSCGKYLSGDKNAHKYPLMFSVSDTLVVTKIDALPYFNFDIDRLKVNVKRISPSIEFFTISAKTDDEMTEFTSYLEEKINKKIGGNQENKN